MGKRNLNLELFVVVSWMNSWVSPFIIPDIICFGFFTLDTRMVKFFMNLGVKFHFFFSREKGWNFCPFHSFREMKVKWKWLEIEIEKWKWNKNDSRSRSRSEISKKFSRILENRDSRWSLVSPNSFESHLKIGPGCSVGIKSAGGVASSSLPPPLLVSGSATHLVWLLHPLAHLQPSPVKWYLF